MLSQEAVLPGASRQELIIFTHIPKTAGNTISLEFRRVYADRALITHEPSLLADVGKRQPEELAYIGGHITYPLLRTALSTEPSEHYCVSLIRDPLRRAISLYLLFLRNDVPGLEAFRKPLLGNSFEYFLDLAVETAPILVVGTQCIHFCGQGDAAKALAAIEANYSLVADTCRFEDFYVRLRHQTGNAIAPWSTDMSRNVTPVARNPDDVKRGHMPDDIASLAPPRVVRKLERIAAADCELVEAFQIRHNGYFSSDGAARSGVDSLADP